MGPDEFGLDAESVPYVRKIQELLMGFFNDQRKVDMWMNSPNPMLGNIVPRDMVRLGRAKKLLQTIEHALSENRR